MNVPALTASMASMMNVSTTNFLVCCLGEMLKGTKVIQDRRYLFINGNRSNQKSLFNGK